MSRRVLSDGHALNNLKQGEDKSKSSSSSTFSSSAIDLYPIFSSTLGALNVMDGGNENTGHAHFGHGIVRPLLLPISA